MAAGGRNPQKSAVARARAQAKEAAASKGGGGGDGMKGRHYNEADAAAAKDKRNEVPSRHYLSPGLPMKRSAPRARRRSCGTREHHNRRPVPRSTQIVF